MARNTRAKKQAEAPKVDIGAEIFASLRDLEKLKGIPVDYMVERLKQALTNAYRKDREFVSQTKPQEVEEDEDAVEEKAQKEAQKS